MKRILVLLALASCDNNSVPPSEPATDVSVISDLAGGDCAVTVAAPADEGASHVESCAALSPGNRPPATGRHYPQWPKFRQYDKPVPWGFLLHGMEHGAVVIAHHCTDCAAQLTSLKEMVEALPTKTGCPRPPVIVTPDPTLDVPFAAAAWGYTLRARCFDRERFKAFVDRRANKGREFSPVDCGTLDLEAQGWCPGS